ncbi:hypothetical protein JW835_15350 [bacterium]|nr:hypothetical protein [bacterium]
MNYTFDEDGDFCFSYTPLDDYHIHNAGAMVASAIIRTGKIIGDKKLIDYGKRNINFIIKYQNGDGSWYYWAPPFKIIKRIDNYHTGFILESLYAVNNIIKERKYSESYNKGVKFYIHNFFESNGASKMTPEKIYPIDIQSCAQSIITLTLLLINDPLNRQIEKTRDQVLSWTLDNMQKSDGSFYYRIYKSGKIDKNSYIRWGESWMFHALSLVMSRY